MNIIQATVGAIGYEVEGDEWWEWLWLRVSPPQRAMDRGEDNFSFD